MPDESASDMLDAKNWIQKYMCIYKIISNM